MCAFQLFFSLPLTHPSCLQISKVSDSFTQWYTGEDNFSDAFLSKVVQNSPRADTLLGLANDIFGAIASTTALYSKAIVHVIDFFLSEEQTSVRKEIVRLANEGSFESDEKLYLFACEALRESSRLLL